MMMLKWTSLAPHFHFTSFDREGRLEAEAEAGI